MPSRYEPPPLAVLLWLTGLAVGVMGGTVDKPNIITLMIDDAGIYDFQSNDPTMVTPNILKLKAEGLYLNQSYSLPMCTPARAAFLTGRYPHTFGLQQAIIDKDQPEYLPLNATLLPEKLKTLGYATHMVGKWHLGFCHPDVTPIGRGFDTFYGFWLGGHTSFFNHTKGKVYDWKNGSDSDPSAKGTYKTDLMNARAVEIIKNSNSSTPFFLYQSWAAVHHPLDVPQDYVTQYCSHVNQTERRLHCAMMARLDKGVGDIVKALKDKGIYKNTVILLLSDNGGPNHDNAKSGSSNWPLRGAKKGFFEGGVRSYTIYKAPGLTSTNITWPYLAHITDWYQTFVALAGGSEVQNIHGLDLSKVLKKDEKSPRKFVFAMNDYHKMNHTFLRYKQWKYIRAIPDLAKTSKWKAGYHYGWYPPQNLIDDGTEVIDLPSTKYTPDEHLLFDLKKDPTEKTNKWDSVSKSVRRKIERKFRKLNKKYPLQPLKSKDKVDGWEKNGETTSCWCTIPNPKTQC